MAFLDFLNFSKGYNRNINPIIDINHPEIDPIDIKNIPEALKPTEDQTVKPIDKEDLLYSPWLPSIGSRNYDYTYGPSSWQPADIRNILSSPSYYPKFYIYSSMEIYWPKVAKCMDFLKNSVSNRKILLTPFDESPLSNTKFELVDECIKHMTGNPVYNINTFKEMVQDIISAYGYGINLQKYKWDEIDGKMLMSGTQAVSGILYEYSIPFQKLYLKLDESEIDSNKYLISIYRNRSTTNMSTFGVYASLAQLFGFQNLAKNYLCKLAEKFGLPLIHGTYPKNADKKFASEFANLIQNATDTSYIVGPEGTLVEFIKSEINGSNNPQQAVLDYCDKMVDLVMLGQNLTTEVQGGSLAAANVHERKEGDVINNLTQFVIEILNQQFIKTILNVNGEDMLCAPTFKLEEIRDINDFGLKMDVVSKINSALQDYEVDEEHLMKEAEEYGFILKKVDKKIIEQVQTGFGNNKQTTDIKDNNKI